jgi:preprotein translocase subunit SecG
MSHFGAGGRQIAGARGAEPILARADKISNE